MLHVFVGIEILLQLQHAHLKILVEQHLDGSLGGVGARGIGIEIHHDAFGVPFERANLRVGERGAATGHHVANARRIDSDHVHVAFHQHGVLGFADRVLGAVQVI